MDESHRIILLHEFRPPVLADSSPSFAFCPPMSTDVHFRLFYLFWMLDNHKGWNNVTYNYSIYKHPHDYRRTFLNNLCVWNDGKMGKNVRAQRVSNILVGKRQREFTKRTGSSNLHPLHWYAPISATHACWFLVKKPKGCRTAQWAKAKELSSCANSGHTCLLTSSSSFPSNLMTTGKARWKPKGCRTA